MIEDLYGSGCAPCVNSAWREWSFQGIRDLAKYDIEGIFLDGPIFAPGACHCDSCSAAFQEEYGTPIPAEEDWKDPAWRNFIEFRYESIRRYLEDARRTLIEEKPGAVIYMNCTGVGPAWPAARDNRRLMHHQDILGAEGGFLYYDLRTSPLWKPGMTARLLETQSGGKPTVVFIAGANKGWDEYLLSPTETRLLFADTVANGASPWYGISLKSSDRPGALAAGEMNRFLRENEDVLAGSRPLARVAILWSSRTADFYRASVPVTDFTPQGKSLEKRSAAGDFFASFKGCYEALLRSHVPSAVIDDIAAEEGCLGEYDLLFAPNCACMGDDVLEAIDDYVRGGGNLVASFETSMYDQFGDPREGFGLSRVLGAESVGGTFGPMMLDYFRVTSPGVLIPRGELSDLQLPSPVYGMDVRTTGATPLALYHGKMPARYHELPPLTDKPALLLHEYGNGRCMYMAGNFFEHYGTYHNPDYRRIISATADLLAGKLVTLENCPSSVEVVLRRQEGRLMVHLVNFTGEMTRPMEKVVRLRDVGITLHGLEVNRTARALRSGTEMEVSNSGANRLIVLPVLDEYEVIVVDLERG